MNSRFNRDSADDRANISEKQYFRSNEMSLLTYWHSSVAFRLLSSVFLTWSSIERGFLSLALSRRAAIPAKSRSA
jgi:hypothetical protein